jgi:hypothetical protein
VSATAFTSLFKTVLYGASGNTPSPIHLFRRKLPAVDEVVDVLECHVEPSRSLRNTERLACFVSHSSLRNVVVVEHGGVLESS